MLRLSRYLVVSSFIVTSALFAAPGGPGPDPIHKCTTITSPGSYILTDNLTATGDCLVIAADHVSVDLAGFLISGDGSGRGISTSGVRQDITVHDGAVSGFSAGIFFCGTFTGTGPKDILIYRVRATKNGSTGIQVCDGSATVRESVANENGITGITVGQFYGSNLVTGCVASRNGNTGIAAYNGSTVIGNTADRNGTPGANYTSIPGGGSGIYVFNSTVVNNTAYGNLGWGIFAMVCPSNVLGNTAVNNVIGQIAAAPNCNNEHNAKTP